MKNFDKKILVIDGDYFGHRAIHGKRITNPEFNLSTLQEKNNFIVMLQNSIGNLINVFNNDNRKLIDNVVIVFDNFSWRKGYKYPILDDDGNETGEYEFLKPYYINDDTPLEYKANRETYRNSNDIDWKTFSDCLEIFRDNISETIPNIKVEGAEGDDNLFFITQEFTKKNYLSIIFANDGDLKSLVNDNVIYLKNSKSAENPNGEFIISDNLFNDLFGKKTLEEEFLNTNKFDKDYFSTLFGIDVYDINNKNSVKFREPGKEIYVTEHNKNLLEKIICGDKKDNIFPLFRWGSGSRNFKPTLLMLTKAFESCDFMNFTEENVNKVFNDKKLMSTILDNIANQVALKMKISKGELVKIAKNIPKHYRHNLKMNKLSFDEIPTYVYNNFMEIYENNLDLINLDWNEDRLIDIRKVLSKNISIDNAKELMIDSLPKNDYVEIQTKIDENNPFQQFKNPLIDEILNS